jgi:uridine kinase
MKPFLIGIAGPSGAGKSELARLLARRLPGSSALVSLDSYYLPFDHLSLDERIRCNWDHPSSLDWRLIHSDLSRLGDGNAIDEPVYRFDLYSRAQETRRIEPAEFVVIEGLFTLYDPAVLDLLDSRIFVTAPEDICLERRIARDTVERGRTRESVLDQWARVVWPMARTYVLPTEAQADLVVSGLNPLEVTWEAVRDQLPEAALEASA